MPKTPTKRPPEKNAEYYKRLYLETDRKLKRQSAAQQEVVGALHALAEVVPEVSVPEIRYTAPEKGRGAKATCVVVLSDWHIGHRITADETEGFGEYNYGIAEKRLTKLLGVITEYIECQRGAYDIRDCQVLCLGDFFHGIPWREGSLISSDLPEPEAISKAGLLLAEFIGQLAGLFDRVRVHANAADNHSRPFAKPLSDGKVSWSKGSILHTITRTALKPLQNVEWDEAVSTKSLVTIEGKRFLCEHGDGIKSWMGIPHYGIERMTAREALRRMNTEKGFDYHIMGHWHVPQCGHRAIINGSLCGTTPYDHQAARHSRPCQICFLVHRKHGLFNYLPIWL